MGEVGIRRGFLEVQDGLPGILRSEGGLAGRRNCRMVFNCDLSIDSRSLAHSLTSMTIVIL